MMKLDNEKLLALQELLLTGTDWFKSGGVAPISTQHLKELDLVDDQDGPAELPLSFNFQHCSQLITEARPPFPVKLSGSATSPKKQVDDTFTIH